jgi:hypothetical protein
MTPRQHECAGVDPVLADHLVRRLRQEPWRIDVCAPRGLADLLAAVWPRNPTGVTIAA